MLSQESLQIIKSRSQTLKDLQSLNDNEKETKILEILKTLSEINDDAYYLGYLYGTLIDIYLKYDKPLKVVQYVNKVILISGMALYEYCGNNCPFAEEKLNAILNCYLAARVTGSYSKLWGKGRILQLQSKYKEAKKFYEKIIEHDDQNINTYRMYARLCEEIYDFAKANEYFSKAEKIQKDPLTECMMATIAIKQYQFTKSETILRKTITSFPDCSFAQYRLIEALEKQNKQEELKQARKELLKKYPGNTKYILQTIKSPDETFLQELEQLKAALSDGIDYTSVNQYFGDYYFYLSNESKNSEEIKEYQLKAIEFYKQAISNNKFCYQAYYNQIVLLLRKTQIILTSDEKENKERIELIKEFKSTFPSTVDDYLYFINSDSSIDKQIQSYEQAIKDNQYKYYFYHYLAEKYFIKSGYSEESKQKLIDLCHLQTEFFKSSAAVFYDCYEYLFNLKLYDEAEKCIKKAIVLSDNNLDIQIIAEKLKFYKAPNSYNKLITEAESKFKDSLNARFYLELALFYYNRFYEQTSFSQDYHAISLALIQKTIKLKNELLDSDEFCLIYALILYCNHKEDEAYNIYNKIEEKKLPLLNQIKDCGDILDIRILFSLFTNKHKNDSAKNICFWTQALLYLLRYNLFDDQAYNICHYTSISALSYMLSDTKMSPFRLCSLGSANDPKEGKIIYNYLTRNINDKELYLKLLNNQESSYTAVQASFTKLEDALTMFRLYGKKDKNEGTGVNLVFNDNFFSDSLKVPLNDKKEEKNFLEKDEPKTVENEIDLGEPLYWILYWDKNDRMYFNPQGIYKTLEINLNNKDNWYVLNKDQTELQNTPDIFYEKYAQNISYVLNQIKLNFETFIRSHNSVQEINAIKEKLLNISYLIKDAAFYDEKELRIIKVEPISNNKDLKHDDSNFTLYTDYSMLKGFFRYPNSCPLEKIIIGPKVEQKETLREFLLNHLDKAGMDSVKVEFSKAPLA